MKRAIYTTIQVLWGFPQTIAGLVMFLIKIRYRHFCYHGAIVTITHSSSSVSLGLFLFITDNPPKDRRNEHKIPDDEMAGRLLVHEYGHTIQSLITGPLYLILIGIPSALWGVLPSCRKKRSDGTPYSAFFSESTANRLGEKITGEKSIADAVL